MGYLSKNHEQNVPQRIILINFLNHFLLLFLKVVQNVSNLLCKDTMGMLLFPFIYNGFSLHFKWIKLKWRME